jgi:hypothetical protein
MRKTGYLRYLAGALGLLSVAISFFVMFSVTAVASCQVTVDCPGGSTIQCSGNVCVSYDNCVSCGNGGPEQPGFTCCGPVINN